MSSSSSQSSQIIVSKPKSVWRNTSIELLADHHPSSDHATISGNFIAVGVFKHHSGMVRLVVLPQNNCNILQVPNADATDGFAYAVIIPDQSFPSFVALASKVLTACFYNRKSVSMNVRRCRCSST